MPDVQHMGNLTFLVRSRSRGSLWHQVDLSEYDGFGACGCEDFEFHNRPFLNKRVADPERKEPGEWQQCAHIERAVKWLGTHVTLLVLDDLREKATANAKRQPS